MRRPRVPRQRIVAKTGGEETTFRSQYLNQSVISGSAAQAFGIIPIDPALHSTNADPGATVARQYQEYFVTSHGIKFTPAVGTTTPGTLWMAYVDNPEIIFKFYSGAYAYADYLAIAQTTRHNKSTPIWEATEFSVSSPPRRKMFSVDTTTPNVSAEQTDRTVQGAYIYATTACPFSSTLGYITDSYAARLKGLQSIVATGV